MAQKTKLARAKVAKTTLVGVGLALGALLLPLANLWPRTPLGLSGSAPSPEILPIAQLLIEECADCHSQDLGRIPWYGALPAVGKAIDQDRARARHGWSFKGAAFQGEGTLTDADCAALEGALGDDSMPPRRYRLLHWNARPGAAERDSILSWVRTTRSRSTHAGHMAPELRGEPIQPLLKSEPPDPLAVTLGERLFFDRRLSEDGVTCCSGCHKLDQAATDQRMVSTGARRQKNELNTPTLFNASLGIAQFWDGRAPDLETAARMALEDPSLLGADPARLVSRLKSDASMRAQFQQAFPGQGIVEQTVAAALARFVSSLVTTGAPFDRYLLGDAGAIGAEEMAGYALFKDIGCSGCHFGRAVGGGIFRKMGRRRDYFQERGHASDADLGRYRVTGDERDRHWFKVPSLRVVAATFPYFHDGSTSSLMEAIALMARYQLGRELTAQQAGNIARFLESLSGLYQHRPLFRRPPDARRP